MNDRPDNKSQPDPIDRCLQHLNRLAAEIPQSAVDETRARILAAVAAKRPKPAAWQRLERIFPFAREPLLAWGLAAAVLAALLFGGAMLCLEVGPKPTPVVELAPSKVDVRPPVAPVPAPPPAEVVTLSSLAAEFTALKAGQTGVGRDFVAKVHKYLTSGLAPNEYMEACLLLVSAYEQTAEQQSAISAFECYLDAVESNQGTNRAMQVLVAKARAVFDGERDLHGGLAYYDLLSTRYPDREEATESIYAVGTFHRRQGQWREAIATYKKAIETLPKRNPWRKQAEFHLPSMLINASKPLDAIAECERQAEEADNEEEQIRMHLQSGYWAQAYGPKEYPRALQHLTWIVENHPNSTGANAARSLLKKMQDRMLSDGT